MQVLLRCPISLMLILQHQQATLPVPTAPHLAVAYEVALTCFERQLHVGPLI